MKRVLLDTNIYGGLVLDKPTAHLLLDLIPSKIIVYGSEVVRAELRSLSKYSELEGKSARLLLLNLYDLITQKDKRTYRTTSFVEVLALHYFDEYSRSGGGKSYEEVRKDFLIVAVASIHALDIVISNDAQSMLSGTAKKAYETVNRKNQLRTPQMLNYREFKNLLTRLRHELA